MKKGLKALLSLMLVAGLIGVCGGFTSGAGYKSATMDPNKKYKSSKVVKSNISVRGTNKQNGSTYRSY
jgi:hypothetical protein